MAEVVSTPRQKFEDNLIEALNRYGLSYDGYKPLTREEARVILRVLHLRRENLAIMSPAMFPVRFRSRRTFVTGHPRCELAR